VVDLLESYDWPGNIRELQNIITRYISLKTIDFVRELPSADLEAENQTADVSLNGRQIDLPVAIEILEKRLIRDALVRSHWHRGKAATLLNIDRKTLYVKLKKYNIIPA